MIQKSQIQQKLSEVETYSVCGGHDSMAREIATLNEFELEKIVREQMDKADAFAISAQFSGLGARFSNRVQASSALPASQYAQIIDDSPEALPLSPMMSSAVRSRLSASSSLPS